MSEHEEVIEDGVDAGRNEEKLIVEDDEDAQLPKRAVRLDDGSIELTLRFPIILKIKSGQTGQVREDRTDRLVFKRLTGAHLFEAQASASQFMRVLMARSTGMSEAKVRGLLERMDASDALAATQVVGIFTGSGQTTGI